LSDITELLGTASVPVVVAGTVYGVFELGQKLASQRAKDALAKWLVSFDVRKAKALPDGTREIFERIFGERHLSLKCFVRSAMFSLATIAFMAILCSLIYPRAVFVIMNETFVEPNGWEPLILWIPLSIFIDYISLFKSRVILRMLTRMQAGKMAIAIPILVIDFGLYVIFLLRACLRLLSALPILPGDNSFMTLLKCRLMS
jgi:hypothetical protein